MLAVNNAATGHGPGWVFFAFMWFCIIVGWIIHTFADRKPNRRTPRRVVELALVWLVAFGGGWAVLGGIGHIGPSSGRVAESIGYAPSMFQWEVGWGDIAVGVLGFVAIWKRDSWLTAAVVALAISYGGDAIGHIMQWVAHANTAPDNVYAIPSDILQPLIAIVLLVFYRHLSTGAELGADSTEPTEHSGTATALDEAAADAG